MSNVVNVPRQVSDKPPQPGVGQTAYTMMQRHTKPARRPTTRNSANAWNANASGAFTSDVFNAGTLGGGAVWNLSVWNASQGQWFNTSAVFTILPPINPDYIDLEIAPYDVVLSDINPQINETFAIDVTVENLGILPAYTVDVSLYENTTFINKTTLYVVQGMSAVRIFPMI